MFQSTRADKNDTRKLIHTINKALDAPLVPDTNLDTLFDAMWPTLEQKLSALPKPEKVVKVTRPLEEMVAEILELTRAAAKDREAGESASQSAALEQQLKRWLRHNARTIQGEGPDDPKVSVSPGAEDTLKRWLRAQRALETLSEKVPLKNLAFYGEQPKTGEAERTPPLSPPKDEK
jgi:hypothetical protein